MSALHDLPGGEAAQEELCTHEAEGDGVHDHFCSQTRRAHKEQRERRVTSQKNRSKRERVGLVSEVVGVKSDRWQSEDERKKKR